MFIMRYFYYSFKFLLVLYQTKTLRKNIPET